MSSSLLEAVERRVEQDATLPGEAGLAVLAACRGRDDLEALFSGQPAPPEDLPAAPGAQPPAGVSLASVAVRGFRGIGPRAELRLEPGPGLTLVLGRNGSGKSSFSEALELLLTNANSRWSNGRSAVWRDSWRNLHDGHEVVIEATVHLDGVRGATRIRREWRPGASLEDGETVVVPPSGSPAQIDALGWNQALVTRRPFLPHNELGAAFDAGPSDLYDRMAQVLGLDELVAARNTLRTARLDRDRKLKEAESALKELRAGLGRSQDPRAAGLLAATVRKPWHLDQVAAVVAGDAAGADSDVIALRQLASATFPAVEAIESAASELDEAAAALEQWSGTESERARITADLLEQALSFHEQHGDGACPVCGQGVLDGGWRAQAAAEVTRLRAAARAAEEARRRADEAVAAARRLIDVRAEFLERVAGVLDVAAALEAVRTWTAGRELANPGELAGHLREHAERVVDAIGAVQSAARAELERRDEAWRPLAVAATAWLAGAREALVAEQQARHLRAAERWLDDVTDEIRAERFAPIAEQARAIWNELRQGSSVDLNRLGLEGSATRRRLEMDVTIDGVEGAALGVMSQGELNSLALSLFLPRATDPESPFRFVVIDDPVQAMDPARVDGLARVLAKVADTRQVVVFTHDDRLPEAVRRLRIPARHVQVLRRAESVVEVREIEDPVSRYFADATALLRSEGIDPEIVRRVVPGLCRQALEAACVEAVRRRQLQAGVAHDDVERALDLARTLTEKFALALFDERGRGGDVLTRINRELGRDFGDAYQLINRGAHGKVTFDGALLVEQARRLAAWAGGS